MDAAGERARDWDRAWRDKASDQVSWYQAEPRTSLDLVAAAARRPDEPIIDVGGGACVLVDRLLDLGYTDLTVLDIAGHALEAARRRLGPRASQVRWVAADVLGWAPPRRYALMHDRAVFHFLTDAGDRARYRTVVDAALAPGGHLVLATFAEDGPERCSGLPVRRYRADELAAELGPGFTWVGATRELHRTPWGTEQPFTWLLLRRDG